MERARIGQVRLEQLERVLRGLDGLLQDAEFIRAAASGDPLILPVLHYHDILSWLLESLPGKLKCHEILKEIATRWPQIAKYADPPQPPLHQAGPAQPPANEHPTAARQSKDSCQQQSLEF